MKAVVILALVACATAKPQIIFGGYPWGGAVHWGGAPVTYTTNTHPLTYTVAAPTATIIAPAFTKTQYHAQDELGQYSYGYAGGPSAKSETKDLLGNVRGSYAYIGADGKEVVTTYVADAGGFRVASNNLPVAPAVPVAPVLVGPSPVQDIPEVAEAKIAHQKAIEEAQARNALADKQDAAEAISETSGVQQAQPAEEAKSRRKRGIVYTSALPAVHAPLTYSSHVVSAPVTYAAAHPTWTYAAHAPVVTYAAAPVTTVVAAPAYRQATLTKVVNTPGHAVSYRVD